MQAKMGTTFEGRLWETVDRGVRFDVCPGFTVGAEPAQQRQGLQQGLVAGPCRAVAQAQPWAACLEASMGNAGHSRPHRTLGQGLSHCWAQADTGKHTRNHVWEHSLPRGCSHLRETRGEVSGLKQRVNTLNLFIPLHMCVSMCARTGFCQETKRKAPCVYAHPSPSPKTFARFLFSRQVFHELQ